MLPKSLTTYTLEETAPLRSSTIGEVFLPYFIRTGFPRPKSSAQEKAIVLGWVWSNGTLQASPHKLAALSLVEPSLTVQGLHSFVGAYKVLSRVLPRVGELLDPLDQATAGKESRGKIVWGNELLLAFKTAQRTLEDNQSIRVPQPQDAL